MEIEQRVYKPKTKSAVEQIVIHALPLLALIPIFRKEVWAIDWIIAISLYFIRMFFVTGGYHRYFSHKTYKTSRFFQFIIAFMAQTSMQKGVLWWGAHHRIHHRTSDTPADPHSMKHYGFWYSHIGWIISPEFKETHYNLIGDFAKYKELRWLNRYHVVPAMTLMIGLFVWGGFYKAGVGESFNAVGAISTVLIAFFFSTMLLYHGTFSINSIMHKFGRPRYKTGDESKNNFILAILTMGEGWHNNHHYYMSSTRQGFYWWEVDPTYYILKVFSWMGLVWDLKEVPQKVKDSNRV